VLREGIVAEDKPPYWFEAKRFGIGWTLPATWQGWVTVLVYVGLLFVGLRGFATSSSRLIYVAALSVLLVLIIVWKGEKPVKWRWGRH
jgi:hypothetical protein